MFGNKKNHDDYSLIFREIVEKHNFLNDKVKALEDYLQIEYKEETTKGYVKKETKCSICGQPLEAFGCWMKTINGVGTGKCNWTYKESSGRKSNNKKK